MIRSPGRMEMSSHTQPKLLTGTDSGPPAMTVAHGSDDATSTQETGFSAESKEDQNSHEDREHPMGSLFKVCGSPTFLIFVV